MVIGGEVTVINGGRGVKRLEAGDFIGLFETSDWIVNNRTRQIGDWTLVAENDVEILFFPKKALAGSTKTAESFRSYLSSLARADRVPKTVSPLPLLDWVASHTTDKRLSDCAIIAHTHIFPTSVALFRPLAHLVRVGNIFLLDKPYSSVRESLNELVKSGVEVIPMAVEKGAPYEFSLKKGVDLLWQRVIEAQKKKRFKKILIIDDGGDILLSIPWRQLQGARIAGVEQTQRGINRIQDSNIQLPSIVSVASSGVKKIIEADFIGKSVVDKLQSLQILDSVSCVGILGVGSIGKAIKDSLNKLDKESISYDVSTHKNRTSSSTERNSVDTLIQECDLVIGATGEDSLRGIVLDRVKGKKILASASSSNIEFRSILQLTAFSEQPFSTVRVPIHTDLTLEILNGGFPVNFDREKEWEPADDIVLTRCLLYIGIMQVARMLIDENISKGIYALDYISQEKMLLHWLEDKKINKKEIRSEYTDVKRIIETNFLQSAKTMPTVWIK